MRDFTDDEKYKNILYGVRGCCINIRDICMDFDPCFKVHKMVYVYSKGITLGQMTILNKIFHVGVS